MLTIRPANDRGHVQFEWLDTWHSFSFGHYYDPKHMGFRALRVINDDTVAGGGGFDEHPHKDMEIITVILQGELAHKDSMGNVETIKTGEVQRMSAGTGVFHSEFNASDVDPVHLLQIWLLPDRKNIEPGYEQKAFDFSQHGLVRVASAGGREGAVTLHQDAELLRGTVLADKSLEYKLADGRHVWVQAIEGPLVVNGVTLKAGDGLAVSDERSLSITAPGGKGDFLLFDLA